MVETDEKTRMHGVPEQTISRDNEDSASSAENVVTCSQKVEDFKGTRELLFVASCSGSFLPPPPSRVPCVSFSPPAHFHSLMIVVAGLLVVVFWKKLPGAISELQVIAEIADECQWELLFVAHRLFFFNSELFPATDSLKWSVLGMLKAPLVLVFRIRQI